MNLKVTQVELQFTCSAPQCTLQTHSNTWSVSAVKTVNTLLTHCILQCALRLHYGDFGNLGYIIQLPGLQVHSTYTSDTLHTPYSVSAVHTADYMQSMNSHALQHHCGYTVHNTALRSGKPVQSCSLRAHCIVCFHFRRKLAFQT